MDGIKINGVTLFIGKLPGRKQECFYFQIASRIWPVAYIRSEHIEQATDFWTQMLRGIPDETKAPSCYPTE